MHDVFEGIKTEDDINASIIKMVLDGRVPRNEAAALEGKITSLLKTPQVAGWFRPESNVMTEAGILMSSGHTRRPDRVIIKDDKVIIVDFKFGEENPRHLTQVDQYRRLMNEMGFINIEAFIWYVDGNKIISV